MAEAESVLERVDKRKTMPHLFKPGEGGRPKGVPNKVSKTIREAVLEAVKPGNCHPEGLTGWLIERANGGIEDRKIFASIVSRVIPVEITGEGGGAIKVELGWLSGRKVANDVIDITPATQSIGEQATTRLETDIQSEYQAATPAAGAEAALSNGYDCRPQPSLTSSERDDTLERR